MLFNPVDIILSFVLLSVLFSFGADRITRLIQLAGFQGVVISIIPFFIGHDMTTGGTVFTLATLLIRGIIIPLIILVAIRKGAIPRRVEPIIGYHASILCGLAVMIGAAYISGRLDIAAIIGFKLLAPTAIALLITGMFLLMARRNAIAMVIGYIMMENGIYLVGSGLSVSTRHIVEFGILLDVLAGVMIMAVILRNIKQTFDDVDTALLRTLKD
ncbi:MAG: hydrogenase [Desulfobacter postgatei]|uniref:Hydrogenase n=1 Tax=Desulfobacter postgatei TaxID=2293 RepID=A0A2G6MSV1_9BACT|nr:MAG: hydrogenase [Desulfobacter postgatei]